MSAQEELVPCEWTKKTGAAKEAAPEKTDADEPGEGQRTVLPGGLEIRWQRGRAEISGWRENEPLWSQKLAFPVANVVRATTPNEVSVVAVDAIRSVVLDVVSGALQGARADVGRELTKEQPLSEKGLNTSASGTLSESVSSPSPPCAVGKPTDLDPDSDADEWRKN